MKQLRTISLLDLHSKGITSLKVGDFDGLTNLKVLRLNYNLSSLPVGVFDNLKNLRRLDLSRNSLVSLPSGIFENLLELEYVDNGGNRFDCIPKNAFGSRTDDFSNIRQYFGGPKITLCSS